MTQARPEGEVADRPATDRAAASLMLGSRCARASVRARRPRPRAFARGGSIAAPGRRALESSPRSCRGPRRPATSAPSPASGPWGSIAHAGRSARLNALRHRAEHVFAFDLSAKNNRPSTTHRSRCFPLSRLCRSRSRPCTRLPLVSVVAPVTARDQVLGGVVTAIAVEVIGMKIATPLDLAAALVAAVRPGADRLEEDESGARSPSPGVRAGDRVGFHARSSPSSVHLAGHPIGAAGAH